MIRRGKRPSLLNNDFLRLFSPIHVDVDILESDRLIPLYEFATLFLPELSLSALNILLKAEGRSRRVIAAIKPKQREELIRELEGIRIEMRYIVRDKKRELINIPINIYPTELLKNVILNKKKFHYNKKIQKEMSKMIFFLMKKTIEYKIKAIAEKTFKILLTKPKIPLILKRFLKLGLINRKGYLTKGTTIEDLISGKYAKLLKRLLRRSLSTKSYKLEKQSGSINWENKGNKGK